MVATGFIHDMISKNQTFEEFLWTIAKGFGEMSYYRERDKISNIEWHLAQREHARNQIVQELHGLTLQKQRLMAMDEAQAIAYGEAQQRKQAETRERIIQEYKEVNAKIDAMTQQVLAWNYPSEHHRELKQVALHQLSHSRQNLGYHETQLKTVLNTRPIEFYQMDCKSVKQQIEARTKELADYEVFTLHLTEWRTQLEASVPIPESMREPNVIILTVESSRPEIDISAVWSSAIESLPPMLRANIEKGGVPKWFWDDLDCIWSLRFVFNRRYITAFDYIKGSQTRVDAIRDAIQKSTGQRIPIHLNVRTAGHAYSNDPILE